MIIFLDEPTSGLSATDAHTVVGCLRNIADQEKTLIVCVIHQVCVCVCVCVCIARSRSLGRWS